MVRAVMLVTIVLALGGAAVAQAQPTDSTFPCSGVVEVAQGHVIGSAVNPNCPNHGYIVATIAISGFPEPTTWVTGVRDRGTGGIFVHLNTKAPKDLEVAYIGFTTTPSG